MTYGPENTAARNAPTSGATSANAALSVTDVDRRRRRNGSGSATTAGGKAFIHPKHEEWFQLRGLDPEPGAQGSGSARSATAGPTGSRFRMSSAGDDQPQIPLASDKRHRMDDGAPLTLWNHDALLSEPDKPLIITEGRVGRAGGDPVGFTRCVSVPNGAPQQKTDNLAEAKRYEFLWRSKDLLDKVSRSSSRSDNDGPGESSRPISRAGLGPSGASSSNIPDGAKDLNDVLLSYGQGRRDGHRERQALSGQGPLPARGVSRAAADDIDCRRASGAGRPISS
jgi:hypothetical protein